MCESFSQISFQAIFSFNGDVRTFFRAIQFTSTGGLELFGGLNLERIETTGVPD